ncbi:NAD(+)/NADH kinase [Natronoglomus mannanivorans]|uniref:NAD kinase n=1 Tax=Natronoglomus mannanivorans TaxID=2979990 RepID=A0AAP2YWT3_9EURY|nr:NAD(+)/NADH kinase [Halobacteria archaeon AArc-xg1-1]
MDGDEDENEGADTNTETDADTDTDADVPITVGIVAQRNNRRAQDLATTLLETLESDDVTVIVDEETGDATGHDSVPVSAMGNSDLVVSIGGDGTFLFVAREAGSAPILGVNLGEVGFLNAVPPAEAVETVVPLVDTLRAGEDIRSRRVDRLQATGDDWDLAPALNEVVVHGPQRGHGGGAEIEVLVDGERYANSHADGVLVATPTGSTAYNLSEGGPLVRPTLDSLVVTQMCATESMPPLVVGADSELTFHVSGADTGYVISDGRNRQQLELPATVTVSVAGDPVTLAGPRVNFFDALEKLE